LRRRGLSFPSENSQEDVNMWNPEPDEDLSTLEIVLLVVQVILLSGIVLSFLVMATLAVHIRFIEYRWWGCKVGESYGVYRLPSPKRKHADYPWWIQILLR
jgi:hypothetical protein